MKFVSLDMVGKKEICGHCGWNGNFEQLKQSYFIYDFKSIIWLLKGMGKIYTCPSCGIIKENYWSMHDFLE